MNIGITLGEKRYKHPLLPNTDKNFHTILIGKMSRYWMKKFISIDA